MPDSNFDVRDLKHLTGAQIAEWCALHRAHVQIDYVKQPDGSVEPLMRAYREPAVPVDLPALVRMQAG